VGTHLLGYPVAQTSRQATVNYMSAFNLVPLINCCGRNSWGKVLLYFVTLLYFFLLLYFVKMFHTNSHVGRTRRMEICWRQSGWFCSMGQRQSLRRRRRLCTDAPGPHCKQVGRMYTITQAISVWYFRMCHR